MAFFKFRSRGSQGNEARNTPPAAVPAESVEAMRRRARHRLIGAAVLVLLGVIGFPLLFDTQPRPISVDIPIEIPDRNKVPPLPVPPAPAADAGARVAAAPPAGGVITESADGDEIAAPAPEARAEPKPEARPEPAPPPPEPKSEPKPEPRAEARPAPAKPEPAPPAPKPAARDDGARARALLDGKPPEPAAAKPAAEGRFIVQVGAFADADKARETRQKLEKAGLKTYTQVAKTADGERTRVRVGPFGSRADAERAAERIKGLALPAAVLTL